MKNYTKIILFSLLVGLYCLLHFTGYLKLEKKSFTGRYCLTTKLGIPDYKDQVFYYPKRFITNPIYQRRKQQPWCGRIMGKGRDQLQIKDGFVYLNGKVIDNDLDLRFSYQVSTRDFKANKDLICSFFKSQLEFWGSNNFSLPNQGEGSYSMVTLKKSEFEQLVLKDYFKKIERFPLNILPQHPIYSIADTTWSSFNFGPIIIPEESYFILSDDRSILYSDSRLNGFYSTSNIHSRVLFQLPF